MHVPVFPSALLWQSHQQLIVYAHRTYVSKHNVNDVVFLNVRTLCATYVTYICCGRRVPVSANNMVSQSKPRAEWSVYELTEVASSMSFCLSAMSNSSTLSFSNSCWHLFNSRLRKPTAWVGSASLGTLSYTHRQTDENHKADNTQVFVSPSAKPSACWSCPIICKNNKKKCSNQLVTGSHQSCRRNVCQQSIVTNTIITLERHTETECSSAMKWHLAITGHFNLHVYSPRYLCKTFHLLPLGFVFWLTSRAHCWLDLHDCVDNDLVCTLCRTTIRLR